MTTLREKLIKIGAKVIHRGRYAIFQLAEVAVPPISNVMAMLPEKLQREVREAAEAAWKATITPADG